MHVARKMLHFAAAISGLLLCQVVAAEPEWHQTGEPVPQLQAFDEWMRTFMQNHDISGGSLAVTRDGRLVLGRGYTYNEDPVQLLAGLVRD